MAWVFRGSVVGVALWVGVLRAGVLPWEVQVAKVSAARALDEKRFGDAVETLEKQLSRIDGDREYLRLLARAYRGYIGVLEAGNRWKEAKELRDRLIILEPPAAQPAPSVGGDPLAAATPAPQPCPRVEGWVGDASENFCVYHDGRRDTTEIRRVAERSREAALFNWAGAPEGLQMARWATRAELYVYADASTMLRASGDATNRTTMRVSNDAKSVWMRRIQIALGTSNFLRSVLPHEVTHASLCDRFGKFPLPRWADEGMAMMAESDDEKSGYLRNLTGRKGPFPIDTLLTLDDYPAPQDVLPFYAQSFLLVRNLSDWKGKGTFGRFLTQALQDGYRAAFSRHYGYESLSLVPAVWYGR